MDPDRAIDSPDSADFVAFGAWVAAIGDADGDAQRDLVVAAPLASTDVEYQAGRVCLMSSTGAVISRVDSPQPVRDGAFGSAAVFLGDLNGDFRREALVGAYFEGPDVLPFSPTAAPNPAGTPAAVSLATVDPQPVRVAVSDALGREVAVLHDGLLPASTLRLDAHDLPAGVYVVRATGEGVAPRRTVTVVH